MTHYSSTMHRLPRGGRGPSPSLGRQLPFLPRSSHPSHRRSTPSLHLQFYGGDRLTQELALPETKQATSSLAERTQHSLMRLPGLYSMPVTREINLSGYQSRDNWKVTKDQSSCRLPRPTSFQKYCVLETHLYHGQKKTFWRIPYTRTIKYGLQFSLILGNFISYHTHNHKPSSKTA